MQEKWYVIHTKPRQEDIACTNLENQGFEVYLPLLQGTKRLRGKWQEVVEPMFPRYLFIHLTMYVDNIAPVRSTRGVSNFVRFGELPTPLPDGFVEHLKELEDPRLGFIRKDPPPFKKGDKATIVDGPLAGLTGIVQARSGQERVILLLNMLGRPQKIVVPRDKLVLATA